MLYVDSRILRVISLNVNRLDPSFQRKIIRYLGHAKGSAGEVRSQLYIALDRGYLDEIQFKKVYNLDDKVSRQIYRFMAYLESRPNAHRIREERIEYNISI